MDALAHSILVTSMLGITALYIFLFARADARAARAKCICGCIKKRHVSSLDWDSDYGNPGHAEGIGSAYVAPGTCRDCRCRHFISDYRA